LEVLMPLSGVDVPNPRMKITHRAGNSPTNGRAKAGLGTSSVMLHK
jgi:hypothetical protein